MNLLPNLGNSKRLSWLYQEIIHDLVKVKSFSKGVTNKKGN